MSIRVAAIQHDIVWEDAAATLAHLTPSVQRAAESGARLIVLPEMFATGWSMSTDRTVEPENGPIASWMQECATELDVWMAGTVATSSVGGLPTNRLLVVGSQGVVHRYDKMHLVTVFSEHTIGEHQRFRAGEHAVVAEIDGVRFGLTVCYDLRFGQLYWNLAEQVDAFLVLANWPAVRRHHWTSLLRSRAIENQAYVIGVNRIGKGGGLDFSGDSLIVDPMGEISADGGAGETTVFATIDPKVVAAARTTFPFLADRKSI